MRRLGRCTLSIAALLALAAPASATFQRLSDSGGVAFDVSFCLFHNCYPSSLVGTGTSDLAVVDEAFFSYQDGSITLSTPFDETRTTAIFRPGSR